MEHAGNVNVHQVLRTLVCIVRCVVVVCFPLYCAATYRVSGVAVYITSDAFHFNTNTNVVPFC
jgi:hypothetical protein